MRPARLISVAGSAFGSFVAPFEEQFPYSGLVHLRGENLVTKGSSASGKSTFIHALNYPLGTCPVPLTALQSWYTKDAPRVSDTYDIDGKIVKISRGKRFLLEIDGVPFNGSADQKEEKIDELFGIDAEMRLALTYRGQRKPGLFLTKTDKKKKEFLTKLLCLDKFEEEQKKALATVKSLEEKILVLNARLADLLARLDTLRGMGDGAEAEASYDAIVKEIDAHQALQTKYEKTVKDMEHDADIVGDFAFELFKPKLAQTDALIQDLERAVIVAPPMTPEWEKLKAMEVTIQTRLGRLEADDFERMKGQLAEAESLRDQWQALARQAQGMHKLGADRDRVAADIEHLRENKCPTCLREWEEALIRLEDLKIELEQINAEMEELKFVQEEANRLKEEYDALPKTIEANPLIAQMRGALEKCRIDARAEEVRVTAEANAAIQQNAENLRGLRAVRKRIDEDAQTARAKKRNEVQAGSAGLRILAAAEKDAKIRKELVRQKLAEEVGGIRERRRQVVDGEKTAVELRAELEPLQVALAKERDFSHLTGREAFRGKVFDEALDAISAETNLILASIANTRNCTLEFKSDDETQDGKLRQEIVPEITINGHKAHSLDWGPSGGMLSAIELAVDLAVGRIIAERTGVCPGWLILDESFDGLGPREKDTCLEMLQLYAADRLVIIVDHTSETAGFFTKNITVRSSGGISTLLT
jgi:DNA repair exonuclease SbcCD ATPase subunit